MPSMQCDLCLCRTRRRAYTQLLRKAWTFLRAFWKRCTTMFDPDSVFSRRYQRYLKKPSLAGWQRIYGTVIPGTYRTLWQVWIYVDAGAPISFPSGESFSSYPDAFTLRRGVKAAIAKEVPIGINGPRLALVPRNVVNG